MGGMEVGISRGIGVSKRGWEAWRGVNHVEESRAGEDTSRAT